MTVPGGEGSQPSIPPTASTLPPTPAATPPQRANPLPDAVSGAMNDVVTGAVSGDWPAQAADGVVRLVDTVRDKTTGPVQTAARAIVYGLLAVVAGAIIAVLLLIGLSRLLNILVDHFLPWGHAWLPYLIEGVVFAIAGLFIFRMRRPVAV